MSVEFIYYIQPINYLLQILGMSYINLNNYNSKITTFIFDFIFSIPVICFNLYCVIDLIPILVNFQVEDRSLTKNEVTVMFIICIVNFFLIFFLNTFYRNEIKTILLKLNKIIQPNNSYEKKRKYLILLLMTLFIYSSIWSYLDWRVDINVDLSHFYFVNIAIYSHFYTTLYFSIILLEIKYQFSELNGSLKGIDNCENQLIWQHYKIERNQQRTYKLCYLFNIIGKHLNLTKLCLNLCKILSLRILLQVTFYFLFLAIGTTPTVKQLALWKLSDQIESTELFFMVMGMLWTFIFFIGIYVICYSWSSVQLEVRKNMFYVYNA